MSIEELRVKARGWANRNWGAPVKDRLSHHRQASNPHEDLHEIKKEQSNTTRKLSIREAEVGKESPSAQVETTIAVNIDREGKGARPKRLKLKEIRGETQTSTSSHGLPRISLLTNGSKNEP